MLSAIGFYLLLIAPGIALPIWMAFAGSIGWLRYAAIWCAYLSLVVLLAWPVARADIEAEVTTAAAWGPPALLWGVPALAICWMARVAWFVERPAVLVYTAWFCYFAVVTVGFIVAFDQGWLGH